MWANFVRFALLACVLPADALVTQSLNRRAALLGASSISLVLPRLPAHADTIEDIAARSNAQQAAVNAAAAQKAQEGNALADLASGAGNLLLIAATLALVGGAGKFFLSAKSDADSTESVTFTDPGGEDK